MSQNEKKGTWRKAYTRPKKWSGARRPARPATTALDIHHFKEILTSISPENTKLTIISIPNLLYQLIDVCGIINQNEKG